MGFGFLILMISFVPLSRAKDLRPAVASAVDRRSAPDALLGEIFNDPNARSLTKLNLEDSDSDNDDFSGSGSELWSGSGELPKPSEDSGLQGKTVTTDSSQQKQQTEPSTQTETTASGSDSTDATSSNTKDDTNTTSDSTNSEIASAAAQNVPQQTSTDSPSTSSSPVTSQGADTKLPSTEDQSQNSVVQTEEKSDSSNDTSAINADFIPAQSQTSLENFQDSSTAALVGQLATGFDDNSMYDPTIVKKTNVPLVNNTMDIPGSVRSSIPQAPVLSPQVPAVRKATIAAAPFKGSFPLQLHKYSPYAKLLKKGLVPKPGAGNSQQAAKKSVVPTFNEVGGLRPLTVNLPEQQQPATNPQGYSQPQAPVLDANPAINPAQMPFGDQPDAASQTLPAAQPFAPVPTESQALDQGPAQNPQQALDQVQGGVPQAPEQAFYPQTAAPSDMQAPESQNMTAAYPMNTSMNDAMFPGMSQETVGIPAQGAQVVPVYQGLKPKKPLIEDDECEDQFDTCPEMHKNDYCTKYPDLMKLQCKKSCGFCEVKKHHEGSSSGYDVYDESGSATKLYYADEVSGSGSGDVKDEDEDDEDDEDEPGDRKSGIPKPLHKVLMSKFSGASGSGSGEFELDESSTSDDDISQSSGSGEVASGSQKKDDVHASMAGSGSGESAAPVASSPTVGVGAAEIGSGSGSLAEDLATGTVSRANEKHSSIPRPAAPVKQVSVYPKIDLKEIAKAVNVYRGVALKMLGEALEGAAEEKQEELSKKSHIPLPPATGILQQMGFPVGYDEGTKRNMIPNTMPVLNPMDPNYGMLGYGNNGYAYDYPQPVANEPLADFYSQYQQQSNMARSEITQEPEEEQQTEEGAAQDEQPQEIQPVNLPTETKNVTETEKQEDKQEPQVKSEPSGINPTGKNNKKSDIVDPYEYVRNMGKGASMEPIRSKTASNFKNAGHSDALILWKNSQSVSMDTLAKKKSSIPQPDMPAFSETQFAPAPEQQFRSDIPQQNTTSDMPQTFPQSAPVFPQYMPQAETWTQNPGDDLAARSQITQGFVDQQQPQQQQQGEQDSSLRELRSYFPEDE